MDKKSLLQILIGCLAAIIVFSAVFFPIKCSKSCENTSNRPTLSEKNGEWDSAHVNENFSPLSN